VRSEEVGGLVILNIGNENTRLERSCLLLGKTSKADNPNTIGQFGEGFKLALLVLTRLGYSVQVETGTEVWTPSFEYSETYQAEVLSIDIKETEAFNVDTLVFCITLPSEEYEEYRQYNLRLQDEVDKYESHRCEVLFDTMNRGKVFVGDLYVCKATTGILYGYNFEPEVFPLGRDRKAIDGFDLAWKASQALVDLAENDVNRMHEMMSQREKGKLPDGDYMSSFAYSSSSVVSLLWTQFQEEYPDCIPVANTTDLTAKQKEYKGFKGVVVGQESFDFLCKSEKYEEAMKSLSFREKELTPEEVVQSFFDGVKDQLSPEVQQKFIEDLMVEARKWEVK
jgi:hypothetical protein